MKRYIKSSTPDATYQNKRNPNKFIETKKYNDGHRVARQYMKWDTPEGEVKNYTGAKDAKRGRYFRTRKDTLDQMLEDYDEVESCDNQYIASNDMVVDFELPDLDTYNDATELYIAICDAYPEYYEQEGLAAAVPFVGGTANFFQEGENDWRLVIFKEDEYNSESYVFENDPYWGTEELLPGEMNDIKLTSEELYEELSKLPGVDLNDLYGLRQVMEDFSEAFDRFR